MDTDPMSALALAELESEIDARVAEYGREAYRTAVQPVADAMPRIGSDGKPLLEGRMVTQQVLTRYGVVDLVLFSGRCQRTGRFETPFKTRFCRGERHPVSPLLERKIVVTACEVGSYEKAAKVCGEWGCKISDDKVLSTVGNVGRSCSDADLPEMCEDAATSEDTLIVMMDGWMARFRGENWGDEAAAAESRVAWHECKSAVIYRLSQAVDISRERRTIIRKHIVTEPAETREASGRLTRSTRRHEDTEFFFDCFAVEHPPCAKRRPISPPCLLISVTSACTGRRPMHHSTSECSPKRYSHQRRISRPRRTGLRFIAAN